MKKMKMRRRRRRGRREVGLRGDGMRWIGDGIVWIDPSVGVSPRPGSGKKGKRDGKRAI